MMVKPGITTLDKCVDSRYTLVAMAAKRARMVGKEQHDGLVDSRSDKPVTVAVNEIANGKVGYVRSEAIHKAQEWEAEKFAAIESLSETGVEEAAEEITQAEEEQTEEKTEEQTEETEAE